MSTLTTFEQKVVVALAATNLTTNHELAESFIEEFKYQLRQTLHAVPKCVSLTTACNLFKNRDVDDERTRIDICPKDDPVVPETDVWKTHAQARSAGRVEAARVRFTLDCAHEDGLFSNLYNYMVRIEGTPLHEALKGVVYEMDLELKSKAAPVLVGDAKIVVTGK